MSYEPDSFSARTQYLAVYIDFENLAIWAHDESVTLYLNDLLRFLARRGRIAVKQAYANWKNFDEYRFDMTLNAIDLVQVYSVGQGKNRADIRIALDALEAAMVHPHLTTFVIVSGDSDFGPLASKLHKYGKRVIGIGPPGERSHRLFIRACDEFLFLNQVFNLKPRRVETNGQHVEDEPAPDGEQPAEAAPPAPFVLDEIPLGDPEPLRVLWQDILTCELSENQPLTSLAAQKLATEAMDARKNRRFGLSVRRFLLANRVLWECLEQRQPEAQVSELRWYMASYASVRAGQLLNRKEYELARDYYLSFFSLLQVDGAVRSRVEGLVKPMLVYYLGSTYRELGLRMPSGFQNRLLTPAEISGKVLEQ